MASAPHAETVPLDGDVIEDLDGTGEEGEKVSKDVWEKGGGWQRRGIAEQQQQQLFLSSAHHFLSK